MNLFLPIALCCGLIAGAALAAPAAQPNIILILVDDLGVGDFGFSGGQNIPTPNADQLAREGVVFAQGYVQPSCSPTRAALLTGRYPQRFGIEDNRPLDGPRDGMDVREVLLPQLLRAAGYHTQLIGKWHLGRGDRWQYAPRNRGFDGFFGYFGAAGQYINPPFSRNGAEKTYQGYNTDILTDEACRYIREHAERPFFLHLATMAAHHKQEAKPADLAKFVHLEDKRRMAAAIISNLDENLGRLQQTLKETRLDEKTLVFLLSDNGGEPAVLGTMNGPHRGQKFDVLEGGIRVPFAMRWPGVIPAGSRFAPMVHAVDVFTTALAAAGVARPDGVDGVDLVPFIRDGKQGAPHERLFWLYNDHKEWRIPGRDTNLARPLRAVREGDFKLVMEGTNAPELFDIAHDPGEARNLAAQQPERVAHLKKVFDEWRAQMKPQVIPDDHPIYGRYKTMKPSGASQSAPQGQGRESAEPKAAAEVPEQQQFPRAGYDRFGGDLRVQRKATGFFRVEQFNGRWFFITPEGHPFVALGANHMGPFLRQQARATGLWARFGNDPDQAAAGFLKTIHDLGFTAGDVYQPEVAYTRTLPWITFFWYGAQNQTFVDVFDEKQMAAVRRRVTAQAQAVAGNPWVLGLGGPDLQCWDDKLVRQYRALPLTAAGRQRYVAFLRERYAGDITKFNAIYRTQFGSFDALAAQPKLVYPADREDDQLDPRVLRWRLPVPPEQAANPVMQADNDAFCALIAGTLFPVVHAACKAGAPQHLFLGEHLAVRMIPDAVIRVMGQHVDAYLAQAVEVSPQRPPEWQVFQADRWDHEYALLQKPMIIVDWGAVFSHGAPFDHQGATIKPEREASDEAARFISDAFDRPYIIGLFLCKLLGDHKNDANFFQDRATRTYLKGDGTPYSYRTECLKRALLATQKKVFDRIAAEGARP